MRRLAPLVAVALLAACSKGGGTSISFNSGDGSGNIVAEGDGSRATIDLPGIKGSFKLPKLEMKADEVSLNGVHLYPGSRVTGFNVDAADDGKGDDDNGVVQIRFDAPAAPATVREWFESKLAGAGFDVRAAGNGLAGKTDEGKPFRLDLVPIDGGKARGTIVTG